MATIHKTLAVAAVLGLVAGAPLLAADAVPTYSKDVAPILNENCVSCHRANQIGPMSLLDYGEVRPWARSIGRAVRSGDMPPWHADPEYGTFANDRSLSRSEVDTILAWVENGAPEGDPADLPEPPHFADDEWIHGEPDMVVTLDQVEVPAGDEDLFPKLVGKVQLPEDKWLTAVEIRPGNRKVVHHVIALQVKGFDVDPQQGWLGAWAAGTDPMVFPKGTGRLLEKGANIIADMHYHPAETDEVDQTRIGLHFADRELPKELVNVWVDNESFLIPAGADNHEVRAEYKFWQSGRIMGLIPHMHYRGKDFTYIAHYPDGTSEVLLSVPRYDFNWQTNYELLEPVTIPAGTRIETIAHYDNSTGNAANPDPTRDIRFGPESFDEMHIGFIDFIVDDGVRPKSPQELRKDKIGELAQAHPGKVYTVTAGDPEFMAPLYLPESGDGVFYVIFDGQLVDSRVYDIEWDGASFSAKVEGPDKQPIPFSGAIGDGGAIETKLGETPFNGSLVGSSDSASGL